ncbi:MAG TPA: DUF58 domain-containing protein [Methylomirabilota bacterium]|jgi:uncharacterized protein (DUF58 family)|nr:DUF58 domain-containing protein [Methylomirabilota bacterium]
MGGWLALAALMVLIGGAAGAPGLFLVAAATIGYGSLTRVWSRYGMGRVEYERTLGTSRAIVGDTVPLDVTIWNRKPLPLPWISAEDLVTDGIGVRERPAMDWDDERLGRRVLANAWALTWFERVVRHFHLDASRRGLYEFGPVRLKVRDLLGRDAGGGEVATDEMLLVGPRTVPLNLRGYDAAPLGERRARRSLHADPALYGGVRPFQPGDSMRQVHWRASARLGATVSRRFEPARGREVVIALDVQTIEGPHWEMTYHDATFEGLCVAAASLARQLLAEGAACGIAAASFTGTIQQLAYLPPRASYGQLPRVSELLARIGPISSRPYGSLLTWLTRRVPPGSVVLTLSSRDPLTFLAAMQRLAQSGYRVEHIAFGDEAASHAASVRHAGLPASTATLDPDWEAADALVVAG